MLGLFAEQLAAAGGPVADIGCGPGHVTAHLHSLGLAVIGIDLAPSMVNQARRGYPDLRFDVGSMLELDLVDGSLAGVVAWYSIIHLPPDELPQVFAQFHRVLRPGGRLLLAFQVGDATPLHLERAFGHEISAVAYRLPPALITEMLRGAGFVVDTTMVREPGGRERVQQAYLSAIKLSESGGNE
jgi:SAM-dependent methyltransferase